RTGGSAFLHERIPKAARTNPTATGMSGEPGKRGGGEISRTNCRTHVRTRAPALGAGRAGASMRVRMNCETNPGNGLKSLTWRFGLRAVPRPLPALPATGHGRPRPRGARTAVGQAGEAS